MKRIISTATALILVFALCACNNSNFAAPNAPTPQSSIQPTEASAATSSQASATQEQDGRGDIFDETTPEGADILRQGVFFYQNVEMSSDYGDGLSPREGAELTDDLLGDIGLYSGSGIPAGQCVYIFLTEISVLDSAMGRECYIYTVYLGPAEGGLMGDDDFQMIYSVSVDYSGDKTAAIYDDFTGGEQYVYVPGEGQYDNIPNESDDGRGDVFGSDLGDTDVPNWWGEFKGEEFSVGFTNFDGTSFWFTFYNLRNGQSIFEGVAVLYPDNEFMAEHGDISFYLYEDFNAVDLFASESSEWAHLRGQYERID